MELIKWYQQQPKNDKIIFVLITASYIYFAAGILKSVI